MYEIMVLNPRPGKSRKRRKVRRSARKSRKGAKIMAKRRKLSAKQIAAGFGGKRRKRVRRAKKRHVVRARRRRSSGGKRRPAVGYVVGSRRIRRRKLNPRGYRRRRHHNPRFSVAGITQQLIPAAYGAGGAIALDVAMGYIPLPAMLTTGYPKHATRIVGALGIGWVARKFLGSKGQAVAAGALTVAMYNLLKDVLVQFAPSIKGLGDYEEISIDDTASQLGAYLPGSPLGAYLPDGSSAPGMGAYMHGNSADAASYDVDDTAGAALTGMDY